jgi:hypothetical protein
VPDREVRTVRADTGDEIGVAIELEPREIGRRRLAWNGARRIAETAVRGVMDRERVASEERRHE